MPQGPLPPNVFRGPGTENYFVAYRTAPGAPLRHGGHFRGRREAEAAAARLQAACICRTVYVGV